MRQYGALELARGEGFGGCDDAEFWEHGLMSNPVPRSFELAFADLYRLAYRVAFRILGDRAEAEDIAQEALARATLRWDKLHDRPEGWVTRVASNLALDRYRRRRRRSQLQTGPLGIVDDRTPLPGCSPGFAVTAFVPGFNGTSPTGLLVGTAPVCQPQTRTATTSPAAVEVDVWSGRTLAGSTTVFSANAPRRYRILVAPGRYRVTSSRRSRHITVQIGRTENVGRFGACSTLMTQTTVPGPRISHPEGETYRERP